MGKYFTLLYITIFFSVASFAQTYNWAFGEGGIGNDAATSVATDELGNTYITGNLAGVADFSGNTIQGKGVYDIFLAKYDANGNFVWIRTAGAQKNDQGNALRYHNGNLYLSGYFNDSLQIASSLYLGKGNTDVFVAKYDKDGNFLWANVAGGTGSDVSSSLDVDQFGNVYIAGSYSNSIQFDTTTLTTTNLFKESFVAKYNSSGQRQWAKSVIGNSTNLITGVASDKDASVYLCGFFGGNFKYDNTTISSSSPSYDIMLLKINTDGQLAWLKKAGSTFEDGANAITCDKDGNPIMVGYFAGTASFDANTVTYKSYNDVFVAKYDPQGNNQWVRAGKGQELDVAYSVVTDDNNNVIVTGMFQDEVDFDGNIQTGTKRDVYIVSYNANGNFRWMTKGGGGDTDCGLYVALKPNGDVVICGYYLYTCSFGSIQIDYANNNDLFIASFTPPLVNSLSDEPNTEKHLFLYPNPTTSEVFIEGLTKNEKCYLLNSVGERLPIEIHENQISLSAFSSGVYLLKISNGTSVDRTYSIVKY
jgi:hypothetical protein